MGNLEECGGRKREVEAEGKEGKISPDALVMDVVIVSERVEVKEVMDWL